jgi:site-specific recombinase XerD
MATAKTIDMHEHDKQLAGILNRIRSTPRISEANKATILRFCRRLMADTLSLPRVIYYLNRLSMIALKTRWKYKADLDKLEAYCSEKGIRWAGRFSETDLYSYRAWLKGRGYAGKTVEAATVLAKQMLKWAWRQRMLRDYRLAVASFPRAKAEPQPCFTSGQVDALIHTGDR